MADLLHHRQVLLAAIGELLELSEELEPYRSKLMIRRDIVIEASRLSDRLIQVQKKIEDLDLD